MTTLICQVQSRLPVAGVAVYGTLDTNTAARMMIAVRDVVADAPSALIIDAAHLVVASERSLATLVELARAARVWPGTHVIMVCLAPDVATMLASLDEHGSIEVCDTLDQAMAAAIALPVPQRRSLSLRPDPHAPAQSRRFVQDVCAGWGIGRVAGLAELVASELVTNAVTHARTPMNVTLRLMDSRLSVDVQDGDPRPMYRPTPDAAGGPGDEHGRGLLLLDAMASAWGSSPTASGKVVWAVVDLL